MDQADRGVVQRIHATAIAERTEAGCFVGQDPGAAIDDQFGNARRCAQHADAATVAGQVGLDDRAFTEHQGGVLQDQRATATERIGEAFRAAGQGQMAQFEPPPRIAGVVKAQHAARIDLANHHARIDVRRALRTRGVAAFDGDVGSRLIQRDAASQQFAGAQLDQMGAAGIDSGCGKRIGQAEMGAPGRTDRIGRRHGQRAHRQQEQQGCQANQVHHTLQGNDGRRLPELFAMGRQVVPNHATVIAGRQSGSDRLHNRDDARRVTPALLQRAR